MILKCLLAVLVPSLVSAGRVLGPGERILGGDGIPIEEAPYQVAILEYDVQVCGGTIYSERIVLTAAHCFNRTIANKYAVRSGSSFPNFGGQVVPVQKAFLHEDYTFIETGSPNDIAVFYLREPLKLDTQRTQSIKLANESPETGSDCRVTGWGDTYFQSGLGAPSLRAAKLRISDFDKCRTLYGKNVTRDKICAEAHGKGPCNKDSGGPLISFPDRKLIGIVSFGGECAKPSSPGLYTSVAHFRSWINNTISRIMENQTSNATGK